MPELPEVKVHAERLESEFAGAVIEKFRALNFTALKTFDPPADAGQGLAIESISSRGKFLRIDCGPVGYLIHLMQGGRLKPDPKQSAKPRGGMARWIFADGRALMLSESGKEHSAGVWVYADTPDALEPIAKLGPDADTVTPTELAVIVGNENMRLHGFLRRQRHLAGIGRRLANEICHHAKLSPFAMTKKLTETDIAQLHAAIAATITESLTFERTQDEMVKSAKRPSVVHHHTGDECPICGDTIREVAYNRYTVHYCATCQTSGKVLADNTTSKFLK